MYSSHSDAASCNKWKESSTLRFFKKKREDISLAHNFHAEIFIHDLISYISYLWLKVQNLVANENHACIQFKVHVTLPSLYENL